MNDIYFISVGIIACFLIFWFVIKSNKKPKKDIEVKKKKIYTSEEKEELIANRKREVIEKIKGKHLIVAICTNGYSKDPEAHYSEEDNFPNVIDIAWMNIDNNYKILEEKQFYILPDNLRLKTVVTETTGITRDVLINQSTLRAKVYNEFFKDFFDAKLLLTHFVKNTFYTILAEFYNSGFEIENRKLATQVDLINVVEYRNKYAPKRWRDLYYTILGKEPARQVDAKLKVKMLYEMFIKLDYINVMLDDEIDDLLKELD